MGLRLDWPLFAVGGLDGGRFATSIGGYVDGRVVALVLVVVEFVFRAGMTAVYLVVVG